jgi:TolB-like protein/Flp pilus assembly protein TadD
MSFLNELKRRDVFRVGVAYLAVSWLILQVTDTIVPILELPEWVLRFILLLLLIGFPVALMLAWVYEITPQGVRKTDVEAATRAAAPGQRLNKLIIGSLLAVVVILIVERISVDENADESTVAETSSTDTTALSPTAIESPRIAVLPFSNVSADPDQEFFSDGMTDELITLLTKVPGLSVAARTSTFSFKGEMADIPTIAAALGATHVLEGSVRTAGNQLRISLNLINASDGYNLWSETYDRTLDDVFAVQSDIAASVTDALQITLLGDPLYLRQTSPEAYSLYLKARYFDNLKGAENWEKAISHYQQALAIDPDYAPAWAGLSIVYRYQANVGLRELDAGMTLAREAAQKALALDEDLAIAWSNLAQIEMLHRRDWDAATRAADQALRIEPGNSDVLNHAAGLQFVLGNTDQAIALLQQAIEIDPLSQKRIAVGQLGNRFGKSAFLGGKPFHVITCSPPFAISNNRTINVIFVT